MPEDKLPNPIYERFTRGSGWPTSMRQTRWLVVALTCTMLIVWLLRLPPYHWLLDSLTLLFGLVAISPVILSVAAITLAHHLIKGKDYQMIRLTPLSDKEVLDGISLAVLFRLRLLRVIFAGLAPVPGLLLTGGFSYQLEYAVLIVMAVTSMVYAVVVWVAQWISISLGVNLALDLNSPWLAILLTLCVTPIMLVLLYPIGYFIFTILTAVLISILGF